MMRSHGTIRIWDVVKDYVFNDYINMRHNLSRAVTCINNDMLRDDHKQYIPVSKKCIIIRGGIVFFDGSDGYIQFIIDPTIVRTRHITYSYMTLLELSLKFSKVFPDKFIFDEEHCVGTIYTNDPSEFIFFFYQFLTEMEKLQIRPNRTWGLYGDSLDKRFTELSQSIDSFNYLKYIKGWFSLHDKMLIYIDELHGQPIILSQYGHIYFDDSPYLIDAETEIGKITIKDFALNSTKGERDHVLVSLNNAGVRMEGDDLSLYPYTWKKNKGRSSYGLRHNESLLAQVPKYRIECCETDHRPEHREEGKDGIPVQYIWSLPIVPEKDEEQKENQKNRKSEST